MGDELGSTLCFAVFGTSASARPLAIIRQIDTIIGANQLYVQDRIPTNNVCDMVFRCSKGFRIIVLDIEK